MVRAGSGRGGEAGWGGFTLVELLVVVGVMTLLLAILLPSLARARDSAKVTVNVANLRSMGLGVNSYLAENDGWFFPHEANFNGPGLFDDAVKDDAPVMGFADAGDLVAQGLVADLATANKSRRAHWADYGGMYIQSPKSFLSPMLTDEELRNFTVDLVKPGWYKKYKWGGYGYNVHFLGREWKSAAVPAYRARMNSDVVNPARTIVIGDSAGSRKGAVPPGGLMANSYVIDAPLYSINGGARMGKYYQGVNAANSDADLAANGLGSTEWRYRCFPAPRNRGRAGFVFADGHAETMLLKEADDSDGDGVYDNGYWNGTGDVGAGAR